MLLLTKFLGDVQKIDILYLYLAWNVYDLLSEWFVPVFYSYKGAAPNFISTRTRTEIISIIVWEAQGIDIKYLNG